MELRIAIANHKQNYESQLQIGNTNVNTNVNVKKVSLIKDSITVSSVKVSRPSIRLENKKNNNKINAKNITVSLNNIKK